MLNAILTVLSQMTVNLPVGTNLGLLHLLWMLMNGALLSNRGALFPALKAVGLSDEATRRAWTAFRSGQWQITDLLVVWRSYVKGRSDWQEHRYEGYLPVPVDITAFWRPKLKDCPSQPYHPVAKRACQRLFLQSWAKWAISMASGWLYCERLSGFIRKSQVKGACGRKCSDIRKRS